MTGSSYLLTTFTLLPIPHPLSLANTNQFSVCIFGVGCISHISGIVWYLSFSVWLISLSIMPSRSTHDVANDRISFLWLNNIPLRIYMTFPSPFMFMGTQVVSVFWLLWIVLQRTRECRHLFKTLSSFPLAVYPEVGLLGHGVVLVLILEGHSIIVHSGCTN